MQVSHIHQFFSLLTLRSRVIECPKFSLIKVPGNISVAKKKDLLALMKYVQKEAKKWFKR